MTKKVNLIALAYAIIIIMISILLGSCGSTHSTCDAYSSTTTNSSDLTSK